jgi:hypothetical protein
MVPATGGQLGVTIVPLRTGGCVTPGYAPNAKREGHGHGTGPSRTWVTSQPTAHFRRVGRFPATEAVAKRLLCGSVIGVREGWLGELGVVGGVRGLAVPVRVLVLVCWLSVAGGDRSCGQRAASEGLGWGGQCRVCGVVLCQASCVVWCL